MTARSNLTALACCMYQKCEGLKFVDRSSQNSSSTDRETGPRVWFGRGSSRDTDKFGRNHHTRFWQLFCSSLIKLRIQITKTHIQVTKGRNNNMFSKWRSERDEVCPELPIKPETKGNEVAIVACGWFWGKLLLIQWPFAQVGDMMFLTSCFNLQDRNLAFKRWRGLHA